MDFKSKLIIILKKETGLNNIPLEIPPSEKLGDYSFPCYILSKKLKKAPDEISVDLSKKLKKPPYIKSIIPNGPYLNFYLDKTKISKQILSDIIKQKEKFGSKNLGRSKKALIEHTSINPNASPHLGRARNAIIGDSLTRIIKFQGFKTEVHYFVNDVGKQIATLVYATKNRKKVTFKDLLNIYVDINKKIKENPKIEQEIFDILNKLEKGDKATKTAFKRIVDICIKGQEKIFTEFGISYDIYDYESKYLWGKKTQEILKMLEKKGKLFKDEYQRLVLDQKESKLPMKSPYLVLTRKDGTSLYPLRDLAYHKEKAEKTKDLNLVVLGEDQKLYFMQLKASLDLLNIKTPEVVHYSFILLKEGKMSTRKGNVVLLEDLMRESVEKAKKEIKKRQKNLSKKQIEELAKKVGYGAIKYSIIKISPNKNVIFDWETALNFEGDSAPYIQYTHARTKSLIKKYKKIITSKIDSKILDKDIEKSIIKHLSQFPEVVEKAYKELKPHLIANYVYELSTKFNEFYHSGNILKAREEIKKARILLTKCTQQTIENAMSLLGIECPGKM